MKAKEPKGDTDVLSDGLSALSLMDKENKIAEVRNGIPHLLI